MPDDKDLYSQASKFYLENEVPYLKRQKKEYEKSLERKRKYNDHWKKQKVNIVDIVQDFKATNKAYSVDSKFKFEGDNYIIVADKVAGYLRIYDKQQKSYIKLDGTIGNNEETHFKIKHREEMNK